MGFLFASNSGRIKVIHQSFVALLHHYTIVLNSQWSEGDVCSLDVLRFDGIRVERVEGCPDQEIHVDEISNVMAFSTPE
jgi:hypothetical protein